jgi:hypothetical protein
MRSAGYQHAIVDSVRGGNQVLHSNSTSAEDTNWQYGYVSSFDSDGFTIQAGSTSAENWNLNAATFVAWNWKANGTGVTNTSGSITSTVSANTTSGFSIVTYTGNSTSGATFGHGLGVAPKMVIVKGRDTSGLAWCVYHSSLGASQYLFLNDSSAAGSYVGFWNNTSPSSTLVSLGNDNGTNGTSKTYVAYCFAEVEGYSKIGSYTGNGSATGPFIYTGFRPAFVLIKNTTSSGPQWWILDNKRNTYNPEDLALAPSLSLNEQTVPTCLNFLSNGFQITTTNGDFNTSGSNYVFMAIAENPFKYSLAR